jgi:hypothetical protein
MVAVCLAALLAEVTLNAFAVFTDFNGYDLAVMTGHFEPLLSKAIGSKSSCLG